MRLGLTVAIALCLLACRSSIGRADEPLTIVVLRPATLEPRAPNQVDEEGRLYYHLTSRVAESVVVPLSAGQRFRMTKDLGEGGCVIDVEGDSFTLQSCPWLPGFTNTQFTIFRTLPEMSEEAYRAIGEESPP